MASNKKKLDKRTSIKILLILSGVLVIFFTYFSGLQKNQILEKGEKSKKDLTGESLEETINTFEDVEYEGLDAEGNKFIINSEYAEFDSGKSNIIHMEKIFCRFFFKDGTILKITSDKGIYNNITNDMDFEKNVKMYYLENKIFAEKASYVNSENYLMVEENVVGEAPEGNLVADKLDFDLVEKKLKISMYNQDKVNIKVNY